MALPTPHHPGNAWLADCARHPETAHAVWAMDGLAPIHTTRWLAAEAQLSVAFDAFSRLPRRRRGPLLVDPGLETAWWLVPLNAAEELRDVVPITVHPPGWPLHCPPTDRPAAGRFWHLAPDGTGHVTDPAYLAAAVGPAAGRLSAEAFG